MNSKKNEREELDEKYGPTIAAVVMAWRAMSPVKYEGSDEEETERLCDAMQCVEDIRKADDAGEDTEVETHEAFTIVFNVYGCWIYRDSEGKLVCVAKPPKFEKLDAIVTKHTDARFFVYYYTRRDESWGCAGNYTNKRDANRRANEIKADRRTWRLATDVAVIEYSPSVAILSHTTIKDAR